MTEWRMFRQFGKNPVHRSEAPLRPVETIEEAEAYWQDLMKYWRKHHYRVWLERV